MGFDTLAVLGSGAIGSTIGAYLTRAGQDLTLIDPWAAHVEEMKRGGLKPPSQDEEFTVRVKAVHLGDVCSLRERFDAVFLTVKSYDSVWAAQLIEPYLRRRLGNPNRKRTPSSTCARRSRSGMWNSHRSHGGAMTLETARIAFVARLAAKRVPSFEDGHGKAALSQFMSGAESAPATAQDCHRVFTVHGPPPSLLRPAICPLSSILSYPGVGSRIGNLAEQ